MEKIRYRDLGPKQREIYDFQKVSAKLADYGFNCIKLPCEWEGADFLAFRHDNLETLRVRLGDRLQIAQEFEGKEIWLAFRVKSDWYLVPHDSLVDFLGEETRCLESQSWQESGTYETESITIETSRYLSEYLL